MEIEGALNFTSRYVLDHDLEVKDQDYFNVKLIVLNKKLIFWRKSIKFYVQICPWPWPWGQGSRSFRTKIYFSNGNPQDHIWKCNYSSILFPWSKYGISIYKINLTMKWPWSLTLMLSSRSYLNMKLIILFRWSKCWESIWKINLTLEWLDPWH